jgi:hypothetical protein
MASILADLVFLALVAGSWTVLYREYLPRLLAQERQLRVNLTEDGPGLSGGRYLAWVVATIVAVLPLVVVYHLIRRSHPPSFVFVGVCLLSWVCILSGHRFHRYSEAELVPEVRFGAFVGWSVAFLLYLMLAFTVLPHSPP